ncbi:hypothetical protein F4859DRAFT_411080 [Xylaria cf. heliscus]|nr:hypothetical protein F4859DRAFT_411080 [Xylaria cf. heliscus]
MPPLDNYLLIGFIIAAFTAPMPVISKLLALMLFVYAPLRARATSDGAPYFVIATLEFFLDLVIILTLIFLIRMVDEYLSLRTWPAQFFELLASLG